MWRTSPEGFMPVVRVSGLDMSQAWALKRTAVSSADRGDLNQSLYAWQSAIGNNPGSPELVRGFLQTLIAADKPEKRYINAGLRQALWLLRLTQTNAADLELCNQLFEKQRHYDAAVYVSAPSEKNLSAKAEAAYLKALFHQGRMEQFAKKINVRSEAELNDELKLYKLAWKAGWSDHPGKEEANEALLQKLAAEPDSPLLNRLVMINSAAQKESALYQQCLDRLSNLNQANLQDHIGLWRLLAILGKKEEAIALAQNQNRQPTSSLETLLLAETFASLDLAEEALLIYKRYAPEYGQIPELWLGYANLLMREKQWEELRKVALIIRDQDSLRDAMHGYTFHLEGMADLGEERKKNAEVAFNKALEQEYSHAQIGFGMAQTWIRHGYLEQSEKLLVKLENLLDEEAEYWQVRFDLALQRKQADDILNCAAKLYAFAPEDPAVVNYYAAALLLNRTNATETVKITRKVVNQYPNSFAAVLNHSLALLQNNRVQESKFYLQAIVPGSLSPAELNNYHFAKFEMELASGNLPEATRLASLVDKSSLFPHQAKWFEEKAAMLPNQNTASAL
ncbi:MAG: hypothetical protein ACO1QB_09630 [Verrucomicrobiales bacterium]